MIEALVPEIWGLSAEKVKDLKALIKFLSEQRKKYFENYLKKITIRRKKNETSPAPDFVK